MTTVVEEMRRTHPVAPDPAVDDVLVRCVAACQSCEQACTACADACLGEDQADRLRTCIRLDQQCADVCHTTARLLIRHHDGHGGSLAGQAEQGAVRAQLEACALLCAACAQECERHAAHHAHCRVCAAACRSCEESCRALLATLEH
ncbi:MULTISPECIES: hypothetical protein [Streptomyces]|uniref:Four-helix bundle copper-binding protein n=1 Tax=Streptomyces cacaoi TaxID=1898 RepID=A0A4Y3QUV9_STRCI|nr:MULTISPECIES: hypothetical protein [Streptomyces]NNG86875.1 four-helix bundle copper-binding protein [Streptomyces cacaoi]QHF95735.1 four-helix bundle copper-binding protein [Streptomyces sp. NHF165]GEB47790.1 hypothetical protein SCA03_03410 [Streptomyces cacaoi]